MKLYLLKGLVADKNDREKVRKEVRKEGKKEEKKEETVEDKVLFCGQCGQKMKVKCDALKGTAVVKCERCDKQISYDLSAFVGMVKTVKGGLRLHKHINDWFITQQRIADKGEGQSVLMDYKPTRVIYNGETTICYFVDGSKTTASPSDGDVYDKENGVKACIVKRVYGNRNEFKRAVFDTSIVQCKRGGKYGE